MWNRLRKHCSDEQLLAHSDGELQLVRSAWVKRHLNLCWDCRARLHELESQTQLIAKTLRDDRIIDPDRISRAKARFLAWQLRTEKELATAPDPLLPSAPSMRNRLLAGACSLALLLVLAGSLKVSRRDQDPFEILARSEKVQEDLFQSSSILHQI